jgi:MFS transporter, SHS family, lactate transporter
MEKVPPKWRGVLSGLLQEGYAFGFLLAAVAAHFILKPYGWRPLFYLGGLPALLALFIRFFVKESEVWKRSKAESWSQLGRAITSHWKIWLYLTLLMAMMNFASHGTQDAYPSFLKRFHRMDEAESTKVIMVNMVGAILGGVAFGLASDRFGRRRMMILAFLGALSVVQLWALSAEMKWIVAGGFLMQFMVQGAWGIIPAHISELAPDQVRGFLPGFAYQCGNLIAASIGWLEARLAPQFGYPAVMATCAAAIFIAAIFVTAFGPERRGIVFGKAAERPRL